jgi:argininosuccinate lyase
MKLWQKGVDSDSLQEVEKFTVGDDRDFDLLLAPFDVLGSIAHVTMLEQVGLLAPKEKQQLVRSLKDIYKKTQEPGFEISKDVEDIHSQVEFLLTNELGDAGKKIHSARSRNDQVLVDVKLFMRHELQLLVESIGPLFDLLIAQSEKFKGKLLPGYTHLQLAMPSSFGLWFGAYAESLVDDLVTLKAAYDVVNKNPLGSAAGYGSSFPINRKLTTELLGFGELNYNVVYAQMGRGKSERIVAMAMSNVADTLAKLAMDACLFLNQNFGFISFPSDLTTGSSIMPHKKNPDVFELVRAHCNQVKALPGEIMLMTTNLPSGYHRDLQLLKTHLFPAFVTLRDCIEMTGLMLSQIEVKDDILADEKYKFLFSVEEVNKLVSQGVPFRDAYIKVGQSIENGDYTYSTDVKHVHEGSIGNLQNNELRRMKDEVLSRFNFSQANEALNRLLQ